MTEPHAYIQPIQNDEHEKLFQGAFIQTAHVGSWFNTLKKYKKLGIFLSYLIWFFLVIHATGLFSDAYRAFLTDHKWFFFVVIIGYFLPLVSHFFRDYFKHRHLKAYQKEIDAKEYLVCYGKITNIIAWHKEQHYLALEVEYVDLNNQIQRQNTKVTYPNIFSFEQLENLTPKQYQQCTADFQPEHLVDTSVRLCVLPHSRFVFDIKIIDALPEQITVFEQQAIQHNSVWHRHVEGMLTHQQAIFLFDISHIFFIQEADSSVFHIKFQCLNRADAYISSQLKNFERFENLMLNYFTDLSFESYQQLKYKNTNSLKEEILWKSPNPLLTHEQKQQALQQLEMKISLTFVGCFILFIMLVLYIHLYALIFLILSIIILIGSYLYCQRSQKYFIPPTFTQL